MTNSVENSVRRQQLQLLKFEKYVQEIVPKVLAAGLSVGALALAQQQLQKLDVVRSQFEEEMALNQESSNGLSAVINGVAISLNKLRVSESREDREKQLLQIMEHLDRGHFSAEAIALDKRMRLIGHRVSGDKLADGGTPKKPPNVAWLLNLLSR